MLKASALYIVIVIALVIAVLCSSLIVAAYFYKAEYQKKFRYDQLENNASSGVNILLATTGPSYLNGKTFSLFGGDADTVMLERFPWGVYDIGISKAFIQADTLYKVFSAANSIDSAKWAALYLEDQDRALSLSGETSISGNAFIPKAGVIKAYVNNKSYQGDDRLIIGKKNISQKKLPSLSPGRISYLMQNLPDNNLNRKADSNVVKADTVNVSFLRPARYYRFGKKVQTLKDVVLSGNIILFSDTTLIIEPTAVLDNVLVFAQSVIVKSAFHGTCQLFAADSIQVERDCQFDYPSALGVLGSKSGKSIASAKISIGENTKFNGLIFTNQQQDGDKLPLLELDKNVSITGQVYSQGLLKYRDKIDIRGSVFTRTFIYQSSYNLMENMLIDSKITSKALSPYYLTSDLMPVSGKKKKVLQWLEKN